MTQNLSQVVLSCQARGWYPEPELSWLDGEVKLLPAGAPETLIGPDELYTISSSLRVEEGDGRTFTCRVQQRNISQTREAHIQLQGRNPSGSDAMKMSDRIQLRLLLCLELPQVLTLVHISMLELLWFSWFLWLLLLWSLLF